MTQPVWMLDSAILAIHHRQLSEHGGLAGIRDRGLLESALMRPRNLWGYSDPKPDLAMLAAAYAFGIAKNHPFLDGNKRTAFVVSETFLNVNGISLDAGAEDRYITFLKLAEGTLSEVELASWIREGLRKVSLDEST